MTRPDFLPQPRIPIDAVTQANRDWPAFRAEHPGAINTTIGVLHDPQDYDYIWRPNAISVQIPLAEELIKAERKYGYQTQVGEPNYLQRMGELVFGAALYADIKDDCVAFQGSGGTGALTLAKVAIGDLLPRTTSNGKIPLVIDGGWANYANVYNDTFELQQYARKDALANHQASLKLVEQTDRNSVCSFQVTCYNPDGIDRSRNQVDEILDAAVARHLPVILDAPYLGLANGFDADRYMIEQSIRRGLITAVVSSASKNMGLYNERVGAVHIVNVGHELSDDSRLGLKERLDAYIRGDDSNPALSKALAVGMMLSDPKAQADYLQELAVVRGELKESRRLFASILGDQFNFVRDGNGLFTRLLPEPESFTDQQVAFLRAANILILRSSRINIGGIARDKIEYVASNVAEALTI